MQSYIKKKTFFQVRNGISRSAAISIFTSGAKLIKLLRAVM
jgi:hypothetical protein